MTSYKTFLMIKGTGDTWTKLVDIKSFPDLGGEPEMLENTTLSTPMKTYEPGLEDTAALTFTANYTPTDYDAVATHRGVSKDYAIWFGGNEDATTRVVTPTGDQGKFTFKGILAVYVNGAESNSIVDMTITIVPSVAPTKAAS
jgi:hypothetical protein